MFTLKERVSFDCDELIKTDLTCPNCSETYNRSDRLPKLLSRCHSICSKCLEGICTRQAAASKGSFPCPICRKKVNIPKGGAKGFPADSYLDRMLSRLDSREVTPECSKHPLEELLYCELCDSLFCGSCDDKPHCDDNLPKPGHSAWRFSTAIKRKSEALNGEADKWISELDHADKMLASLEENIKRNSEDILDETNSLFKRLSKLLNRRLHRVSSTIKDARDKKLQVCHDQRQWIIDEKARVTAGFKRFKHQGTVGEVKKKIEELHESVESKRESLIPKENCFLRFVDKKWVVDRVQKDIELCGGLKTSKISPSLSEARIGNCFALMRTPVTIITRDFSGNNHDENNLDAVCGTVSYSKNGTKTLRLDSFDEKRDGSYEAQFVILKSGTYNLAVTIFGCLIKNHPVKFEVKNYENSIYNNDINNICERFPRGILYDPECVKLTINRKNIKICPSGWTSDTEPAPPFEPLYCRLLGARFGMGIECAANFDDSQTPWICGGNSVRKVNLEGKEDDWISDIFSLSSELNCIELVPGYRPLSECSPIDINVDKLQTKCFLKRDVSIYKARPEVTFRHEFENLSRIKGNVYSPPVFARNLSWRIHIQVNVKQEETESVKTLGVYLKCDGCPKSWNWYCKAEAELRLMRQNGDKPLKRKFGSQVFAPSTRSWGFFDFANLNDILDPEKGFIKDDSIILEVSVSADTPRGVSEDFMEDADYVFLEKQATSASLSDSFSFLDVESGSEPPLNQDAKEITPASRKTSTIASIERPGNSNSVASSTEQDSSPTSTESIGEKDPIVQTLRTAWLGCGDGTVYIVSAEDQSVYSCIKMKLVDYVNQIMHLRGKVFIALANGHCCIFIRSQENLCWNFSEYYLVDMSEKSPEKGNISCTDEAALSIASSSVEILDDTMSSTGEPSIDTQKFDTTCMEAVGTSIWFAHHDSIHIIDCETLKIISQFRVNTEATRIVKLSATEGGVWCSYCSQSDQMIQLFSAMEPYGKIMSVDIRPDLEKMLIPVLSDCELDSVAKITALRASNGHLWVGTAAGIIVCIPYKFTSSATDSKCVVSQAQLSLHGFGGAVKFFLQLKDRIISGGQGYRDLCIDPEAGTNCIFDEDRPHMLVWQERKK